MILAAGYGTRLLPHTKRIPKPLFPVLDKTLLEYAIETALGANPEHIVVNTHHLAEHIAGFLEGRDFGVEIAVSHEPQILGTAGGIKAAERWLRGGHFAVLNSDILIGVEWERLESFHLEKGAIATLALKDNPDPSRYGVIGVDGEGRVTRFVDVVNLENSGGARPFMFTGASILSPGISNGLLRVGRSR